MSERLVNREEYIRFLQPSYGDCSRGQLKKGKSTGIKFLSNGMPKKFLLLGLAVIPLSEYSRQAFELHPHGQPSLELSQHVFWLT